MPKSVGPIRHTRITRENKDNIERVARRRHPHPFEASLHGDLSAWEGSVSVPWTPDEDCDLDKIRALLTTAGTSDTVLTVLINGISVGTVTIASGDTNTTEDFDEFLSGGDDILAIELTTAGAGAEGLYVKGRMV